ncbi:PEP-utilizing enzyme [Micromonospora sp. LOL_021]|uniref:PEP-utilizing enzyme n=1 Tax=Micromonospora sp. LOL_021 TaxID=3345417 RepID=UPI003A85C040
MLASWRRHRAWHKINFRRTETLLAAEFLHGLYQRHNPFLNPFRFANTAVVFAPWETTSYAPTEEWERLARRFGARFLLEPEATAAELEQVLTNRRPRSRALAAELEDMTFAELDDATLLSALVRLQHVPLGEIYEVNLVQVEHALHAASRALASEYLPDASAADRYLAALSTSAETTAAGDADEAFLDLVRRHRAEGGLDPTEERAALLEIVERHTALGSAYGAQTVTYEGVAHRFRQFVELPEDQLRHWLQRKTELPEPVIDDPRLNRLLGLLRYTGEVRDRNKKLLGSVTRHRLPLLTEIAGRTGTDLQELRLYLLEEIIRLVEDAAHVPGPVIDRRRAEGVVLRRHEGMDWPDDCGLPDGVLRPMHLDGWGQQELRGLCAAPGRHTGVVRNVSSAADLTRMQVGDVIVAPGTDFDLILLLRMAGAIVTEEGGLLSHSAVVARERGIPSLIGVARATKLLRDGEVVTVDADRGLVITNRDRIIAAAVPHGPGADDALLLPLSDDLNLHTIGRKAAGLLAIRAAGHTTPADAMVVPTAVCDQIRAEMPTGGSDTATRLAQRIAARFAGDRVSLRSSSLLEDMPDGTAAGVYHSEAGVETKPAVLVDAIHQVVSSGTGDRSRAYHGLRDHDGEAGIAILVTRYERFTYQGTAVSHSPWDGAYVMVEYYESDGTGGCPDRGGEIVHFPHAGLAGTSAPPPVPHLVSDLGLVASLTLNLASRFDGPIEVEWGIRDHVVTLLQARRLHASEPARSESRAFDTNYEEDQWHAWTRCTQRRPRR